MQELSRGKGRDAHGGIQRLQGVNRKMLMMAMYSAYMPMMPGWRACVFLSFFGGEKLNENCGRIQSWTQAWC